MNFLIDLFNINHYIDFFAALAQELGRPGGPQGGCVRCGPVGPVPGAAGGPERLPQGTGEQVGRGEGPTGPLLLPRPGQNPCEGPFPEYG